MLNGGAMRSRLFVLGLVLGALVVAPRAPAEEGGGKAAKSATQASKPWCAPELTELSDHVCYFDGQPAAEGRRTLVVYLHGALATTPGFFYLQQRAMAIHAKRLGFTVFVPASPKTDGGYVWPTAEAARKEQEPQILAGIRKSKKDLEQRLGHRFDETFVVGFSSGAYYGSSVALRGALDVDGYIVLAGGSSWARPDGKPVKRAPVFVGVSAADPQTADHSRALAGTLAGLKWPFRVEERDAGHMVDWTFMAHGIAWLRSQTASATAASASAADAP
jgi:predicted esterase